MLKSLQEFIEAFGQNGETIDTRSVALSARLISEEHNELQAEIDRLMFHTLRNETVPVDVMQDFIKELTDLLYVVMWTAARHNIDIEEAFRRVHASNMSKLGPDGKPMKDSQGKVMKGPYYHKPNLVDVAKQAMR